MMSNCPIVVANTKKGTRDVRVLSFHFVFHFHAVFDKHFLKLRICYCFGT